MPEPRYKCVNGEYIELSDAEIADMEARAESIDLDLSVVRSERNGLLAATDWTRLDDAVLGDHTKEEWATYRQSLRDLPSTTDRWSLIVWPNDPPTQAAIDAAE